MGLEATAAQYQTKVTRFAIAAPGLVRVLIRDPKRWFVRFERGDVLVVDLPLLPEPYPTGLAGPINQTFPIEFKFRDCPSVVTGEWYGSFGGGSTLIITECVYVGE